MKVKIISDNADKARRLQGALSHTSGGLEIMSVGSQAGDLINAVNGSAPDIVVLDAFERTNLEALERLTSRYPQMDAIVLTADQSPDFLLGALRAGVREVLPMAPELDAFQAAFTRLVRKRGASEGTTGRILAMISCKGGSGATFLATNLGYVLAANGQRVALVDLNLQFGDAAMFVTGDKPPSNLAEVCQQVHRLDADFLSSAMMEVAPNFHLLAAPEDPAQAIDVKPEHVEAVLKVARTAYDFVIVDVSRSLDAVNLKPFDMADMILPVMQLTLPFIRDAKRLLEVFLSLGYPLSKVSLIVNRYHKDEEIGLDELERAVGVKVFKTVPNSYAAVAASVNQGIPIAKLAKGTPVARALNDIAQSLVEQPARAGKGWFARLFASR